MNVENRSSFVPALMDYEEHRVLSREAEKRISAIFPLGNIKAEALDDGANVANEIVLKAKTMKLLLAVDSITTLNILLDEVVVRSWPNGTEARVLSVVEEKKFHSKCGPKKVMESLPFDKKCGEGKNRLRHWRLSAYEQSALPPRSQSCAGVLKI